jgi:hypothetical protein
LVLLEAFADHRGENENSFLPAFQEAAKRVSLPDACYIGRTSFDDESSSDRSGILDGGLPPGYESASVLSIILPRVSPFRVLPPWSFPNLRR